MGHGLIHGTRYDPRHGAIFRGALLFGDDVPPGPDPGVDVTEPYEAFTGAQLTTQLGFGGEGIWRYINHLNDLTGNQYPAVGVSFLSPSAGGIQGTPGPLDSYDFGVTATDGDADGQWSATAGVIDPAGRRFIVMTEVLFNGLPAGNRNVCGHDGTDDFFIQYMQTTGRLRAASVAGTTVTSGEILVNHNTGQWHTVMAYYIPGVGGTTKIVSELGTSTTGDTSAQAQMDWTGAFFIHRNTSAAPCTVSFVAVAISDGSPAQDAMIQELYDNAPAAIANYRAATGR